MSGAAIDPKQLLAEVVACLGLSMLIGPGIVRRALQDAGYDPATADADAYLNSLDRIGQRLKSYAPPGEVEQRIADMRALLQGR